MACKFHLGRSSDSGICSSYASSYCQKPFYSLKKPDQAQVSRESSPTWPGHHGGTGVKYDFWLLL